MTTALSQEFSARSPLPLSSVVSVKMTKKVFSLIALLVASPEGALAFSSSSVKFAGRHAVSLNMGKGDVRMQQQQQQEGEVMEVSRRDAATRLLGAGLLAAAASGGSPLPAAARGRSTQVAAWSRYGARIQQLRSWLAGDLKAIIASSDYDALKTATAPKKSILSNYLGAMDLWAATYSDASPSPKTLRMLDDVVKLRQAQAELNVLAMKATGEGLKTTGGVFGLGGKKEEVPTAGEMKKLLTAVQKSAIEAYNDYAVVNNDGHPFEVDELLEISV